MKIIFAALLLCITFSTCSVAQTKPTKQETIDWITDKIRNYNVVTPTSLTKFEYQITEDGSITQFFYTIVYEKLYSRITTVFSAQNIYKVENSSEKDGITVFFKTPIEKIFYLYSNDSERNLRVNNVNFVLDWTKEQNLRERMLKALSALAEYNNPKVKEVY